VAEAVAWQMLSFTAGARKLLISPALHPQYRQTLRTYVQDMQLELVGDDHPGFLRMIPVLLD